LTEKTSQNEKKLDNEALFNAIITKLRVNKRKNWSAPAGNTKEDVEQAWERLGQAETERGKALRDNLLRLKEGLRKDFADLANDFQRWVLTIKAELVKGDEGSPEQQLEDLNRKEEEINNDQRLANLEASNKRLEEAGIDENPYTDFTFEELSLLWEQMKNVLKKRKQYLADQLATNDNSGITDAQLNDFREAFKHFDKDNSNHLDKLEFKACLQSLGQNLTDAEFNKLFEQLAGADGKVSFDEFVKYMISVTQDTDTADQIKQSFKQLANDAVSLLFENSLKFL
jgi:Ca2+-binding EF-hand superfamily protein